jgi:3-hydroxyacyl-[acyl-carrier-protein] dehydratase
MSVEAAIKLPLDSVAIQRILPHRYPFLLIDRVIDYSADGERCVAIKNVTINEPFFVGHFPGHPVMPGVLLLEAMAQTSAVHARLRLGELDREQIVYLVAIDRAKFRKIVEPGDQLQLHSTLLRGRGRIWKFRGQALVGDQVVAEAEYMATLPPSSSGAEAPEEPAE